MDRGQAFPPNLYRLFLSDFYRVRSEKTVTGTGLGLLHFASR